MPSIRFRPSVLGFMCLLHAAAAVPLDAASTLEDDIKVYAPRAAHGQSASRVGMRLWLHGKVNFFIDPADTASHDPGTPLDADDERVLSAVAHWNARTCIEFTRCASLDDCPRPLMRFVSQGSGCSAPLGRTGDVVTVEIGPDCAVGNTIHEIGHSIGLNHEQRRNDRDEYIGIDWDNVGRGNTNYHKLGANGRALGPYDYGSIMHYPKNPWRTTITAPAEYDDVIGQRIALSPLDIAAVHFMYNTCSDEFAAPVCVINKDEEVVHEVPAGVETWVEVNAQYSAGMVAAFDTDLPADRVETSVLFDAPDREGEVAYAGAAVVRYTPTEAEVGSEYTAGATFEGADGKKCAKSVRVRVVPAPTPEPAPTPAPEHVCEADDIAAAEEGVIDFPAGEGTYANSMRRCWRLECSGNITLEWRHFDVEEKWDVVTVSDEQAAELARFTGHALPALHALQGTVVLAFRSDASTVKTGFELAWSCVLPTPPPTPPTTPSPPACADAADWCPRFSQYCKQAWVAESCAKTCRACPDATPCPEQPWCEDYKHLCVHESVRATCPTTCGACH